jgi:hypothetical protein
MTRRLASDREPLGLEQFPVAIARGKHLFPFRTEQLSPAAPMVLGTHVPGRVGRRRFFFTSRPNGRLVVVKGPSHAPPGAAAPGGRPPPGSRRAAVAPRVVGVRVGPSRCTPPWVHMPAPASPRPWGPARLAADSRAPARSACGSQPRGARHRLGRMEHRLAPIAARARSCAAGALGVRVAKRDCRASPSDISARSGGDPQVEPGPRFGDAGLCPARSSVTLACARPAVR